MLADELIAASETFALAAEVVLEREPKASERLCRFARAARAEAIYLRSVEFGYPAVRRRGLPPGASIGWLFRNCAVTRQNRRSIGLTVPDALESAQVAA